MTKNRNKSSTVFALPRFFSNFVIVMINWYNWTSCRPILTSAVILVIKQIGLPLKGRPILFITCTPLSPVTIINQVGTITLPFYLGKFSLDMALKFERYKRLRFICLEAHLVQTHNFLVTEIQFCFCFAIIIGVRAGGAAAPPISENFGQNAKNSGNEETINKRLN